MSTFSNEREFELLLELPASVRVRVGPWPSAKGQRSLRGVRPSPQ